MVPLGSQEFTESFVKRDLLDVAEGVMSKLIDFEDTQADIFLLRLSFGIVRATHFMRTTPLSLWSKQAGEFDEKVSQTVFQCLGLKPTDEAYAQASVSPPLEDWGFGVSSIMPMERLLQVGMKPRSSPVKSGENRLTRTAQGCFCHD